MGKKYIFRLLGISFLLCNAVAFLDEGLYSLHYLTQPDGWGALIIYTVIFMLVPITLFISIKKNVQLRFYISLLGFLPVMILILYMIPYGF